MLALIDFFPPGGIIFLIPVVAIIMGMGTGMLAIYFNYRKRKEIFTLYHQERMAALDKGIEVPPLPDDFFREDNPAPFSHRSHRSHPSRRHLLKSLIFLFVGLALGIAIYQCGEPDAALFALIPIGIGLAFLIYYFAVGRKEAEAFEAGEKAKLAETNRRADG
ncbi:MAG: DUF6249 domain-containing protein [Verrucomicrobiota bacterium]|jgi:hypothetical protein